MGDITFACRSRVAGRIAGSVLGIILVSSGALFPATVPGDSESAPRHYPTPHGELVLVVPSDWRQVDPHDSHDVAQFEREDRQGMVRFTLIADPTDGFTLGQLESGFGVARWGAKEAAERGTVSTYKLSKPGNRGFYLTYKRKAADENGFWYRMQGSVLISDLSFAFAADYNSSAGDFVDSIKEVVQSARLEPVKATTGDAAGQGPAIDSPDAAGSTWRRVPLPGHGAIELLAPRAWKVEAGRPREDLPPTIKFSPNHGSSFLIQITVFWSATGDPNYNGAAQVLKSVEAGRDLARQTATESELHIREFHGEGVAGYYFQATDRDPRPGEWRYLTQGAAALEDLLLGFTVLSHDANQPEASATLDILKKARKSAR